VDNKPWKGTWWGGRNIKGLRQKCVFAFGDLPTIQTRKALLLLDFQNDFVRPSGALHKQCAQVDNKPWKGTWWGGRNIKGLRQKWYFWGRTISVRISKMRVRVQTSKVVSRDDLRTCLDLLLRLEEEVIQTMCPGG
jgi:hypothetical protein